MNFRNSLVLGATVFLIAGCGGPDTANDDAAAMNGFELHGDAGRGAELYARNCASCHGNDGRGDGAAGRALNPPPTDFTTAGLSAERAYIAVRDGGMAVGLAPIMPPFGGAMDDQGIRDVVAYILEMEK